MRGCTKISPGCKHCYAEAFAERFRGVKGHPYERGFDIRLVWDKVLEPFSWTSSRMVFVNSMSDLFHPEVPDAFIIQIAKVMMEANWHTYQLLTKRSDRLKKLLNGALRFAAGAPHIWWGVSVENIKHGKPRIEHLRQTPAAVKFLSVEPLLEDLGTLDFSHINWVIVGGESGPGARPMQESWALNVLHYCRMYEVPFFFKQWGGVRKHKAGRHLQDRTFDEFPITSRNTMPPPSKRKAIAALLGVQLADAR